MRYAINIELNSDENGYIESSTYYNVTKKQMDDLIKEAKVELEEEGIDYIQVEVFKLRKGFDENDNWHRELYDINNNMAEFSEIRIIK